MIIINHSTGHCISIASVSSKWIQTKFFPGSVRGSFCIWIIFEEESNWNSWSELQCPGVRRSPECSGEEMCPLCEPDFQVTITIIIRSLSLLLGFGLSSLPLQLPAWPSSILKIWKRKSFIKLTAWECVKNAHSPFANLILAPLENVRKKLLSPSQSPLLPLREQM